MSRPVLFCPVRYGWHFPELGKIIADNLHYARTVKLMGHRVNCAAIDFSEVSDALRCARRTEVWGSNSEVRLDW